MHHDVMLAKTPKNPACPQHEETLIGHVRKVAECFQLLFGHIQSAPTRLALQWKRFFRLTDDGYESFYRNALVSCGLHDAGKANNGFQDIVHRRKGIQAIRHEHLAGLILWLAGVQGWLESIPGIEKRIVLSSVIGHHLRADSKEFATPRDAAMMQFKVYREGVCEVFDFVAELTGIAKRFDGEIPSLWSFGGSVGIDVLGLRDAFKRNLARFRRDLEHDAALNGILMASRAALILADSAGSAIVREGKDTVGWLERSFSETLNGGYIETHVIKPRVQEIQARGRKFRWSDFQVATETLPERALLLAPCGSGKTLAAWRWIKARLDERPAERVIFLYPTRATATEGFRDYVSWAPESDASLISGTSAYELQGMFDEPEDERSGKNFSTEDRMFALGYWHRRIFSATVDQFLGFMQQVYRSVCLLPLLADSVVVIDEVHSFDRSLFSALRDFLKHFDIPVLCMTASLPRRRREELTNVCGLTLFPEAGQELADLQCKADMPRYTVCILQSEDEAMEVAERARKGGKRVLWVVNRVDRCQRLARKLNALCYHSRFKLEDRKERHGEVVRAFKTEGPGVLAITTQVCEMSLDLDADVLISEVAPIPSIIQRMGRCNRHALPGDGFLGQVFFYVPEDWTPYVDADMTGHSEFLDEIAREPVSQSFLGELLERYGNAEKDQERYTAFIKNGPWAMAREHTLRDEHDFTVSAVLDSDLPRYFEMIKGCMPTDGLLVPVPRRFSREHSRLGRFPLIAEAIHYLPQYGFLDHPPEEII